VLIATLRHELRTPLNSIIGFAELLLSGVDGELTDTQREDVEVVARSGRHLLHLVDDVLDLSAIASGRFEIERSPVDLVSVAREVLREAGALARRKNVTLSLEAQQPAIVQGDALSLRRAVTNLVQNAIEHAGGRVVVEVVQKGRTATISVRDNGPGITPQELKRLFKPFERGRVATSEGGGSRAGAGLGLAIALALLEVHGGSLGAESEVGKGSTFVATLPLQPTALAQAGFA
jgi:signal transduction histidine kinase